MSLLAYLLLLLLILFDCYSVRLHQIGLHVEELSLIKCRLHIGIVSYFYCNLTTLCVLLSTMSNKLVLSSYVQAVKFSSHILFW